MRGIRWFSGVVVLTALAGPAWAQCSPPPSTVRFPQCFLWQSHPVNVYGDFNQPNPAFAPIITLHLSGSYCEPGVPCYPLADPDNAARAVVHQLIAATTDSNGDPLPPEQTWVRTDGANIDILLADFGHPNAAESENATDYGDLSFFRKTDDENAVASLSLQPRDFPSGSGLLYAHPFLANATTNNAALRGWMVAFRDSLRSRISTYLSSHPSEGERWDVNHWRFYFDQETQIGAVGSGLLDTIYMLQQLAFSAGDPESIWNTWPVPGAVERPVVWQPCDQYPPTTGHTGNAKTLAQLYEDARTYQIANGVTPFPEDEDLAPALHPTDRADSDFNRRFMAWWWAVLDKSRDSIMRWCAYDVLHDGSNGGWPGVRCGNYKDARYDGAREDLATSTTWFYDKGGSPSTLNPYVLSSWAYPFRLTRDQPRIYLEPGGAAKLMERDNVHDFWMGYRKTASGEVDSPELYPIVRNTTIGLDGWSGAHPYASGGFVRGAWEYDPYVPENQQYPNISTLIPWPSQPDWTPELESRAQARLRLHRHDVESILNSVTGDSPSAHQDRLAPWVNEYVMTASDQEYHKLEREQRMVLEMLRAKNVPEVLFWFHPGDDNPYPGSTWDQAWRNTVDLVRRVWATRVASIGVAAGTGGALYPGCASEPDRLEYTLRDSSARDSVVMISPPDEVPTCVLEVTFSVPAAYASGYDFEINLECAATQGTVGTLTAYAGDGNWHPVRTLENQTTYTFDTADWDGPPTGADQYNSLGAMERRPTRRTFVLKQSDLTGGASFVCTENGEYRVKLRFAHTNNTEYWGGSEFDLVQLVPVWQQFTTVAGGIGEEDSALSPADLNADTTTDGADVLMFIDGYTSGTSIADINMDQSIDSADVAAFADSYASGM